MSQSDKPSVDGLMELVYEYGRATDGPVNRSLAALNAVTAYAERLAALAGPLEQPQEPTSDQANLAQASGGDDLLSAPPFGSKRAAALALYRPPFKFHFGYIHDGGGRMVADQDGWGEGSKVHDHIAARVRGWGRIGYLPDPEALQDEVGAVLADALTAYWEKHSGVVPVGPSSSEPLSQNKPAASSESSVSVPKEQQ